MKHSCGEEMRDMGRWPINNFQGPWPTQLQYRYRCDKCKVYESTLLNEYINEDKALTKTA